MVMKMGVCMVTFYQVFISVLIGFTTLNAAKTTATNKTCTIKDTLVYKNGYSHQYVFHSSCPVEYQEIKTDKEYQMRIFIPHPIKDQKVKKSLEEMNVQADSSYHSIKFIPTADGVECIVDLNPDNLGGAKSPLELQKTTSITGSHGLVIKVHNMKALTDMQAKSADKRIKRLAYSAPQSQPTIIVDCGHGGKDGGYSDGAGLHEKNINKLIGDKVVDLLKKKITRSV